MLRNQPPVPMRSPEMERAAEEVEATNDMGEGGDKGDRDRQQTCSAALDTLLNEGHGVVVAALGSGARVVSMPPSFPLRGHGVFEEGLSLDLVVADDRLAVIEGWALAQQEPVVRLEVHLRSEPDRLSTVSLFDVRSEHGVHLLIVEAHDPELLISSAEARAASRRGVAHARKDATSVFLEIDEATTELLGWTPADLIGRSTVDFVHPEDVGRAIESWIAVRAGHDKGRLRVRYRHADGHHVWLEVTNQNRLDDPELGCILSEMVDISAEMAQVEELRDRERLLARLADALPIGICHLRPDMKVAFTNEPLVALLGQVTSIEELMRCFNDEARSRVDSALQSAFRGVPTSLEVDVLHGPERRCELTFRSMTTDSGHVDGVIVCATDVTDRSRLRAELEHRASHDTLTGCLNRAAAVGALEAALRESEHVAVAYIDLDDFKVTNDQLGHAAGDELLRVAAARLRAATRDGDRLARLGGDEFVVICRQSSAPFDRGMLLERLTRAIEGDVVLGTQRIPLSASVGVAIAHEGEHDPEAVLHRADLAMYRAKRSSRTGAPALTRPA